ncbi:Cro/CI family transcriptional regulator [Halomonas elongata]|uniref:Cro/CI family transcriptional regulator n=1 Tax=Halomonas elongata TaxID=2746 RepID=UPI0023AF5D02|nr:Cro/CI family transcriptional regulator [Halomonas elongata]MDL4862952.1 Cro/CI family transcriptional regulator [Halomonas elongata]
MTKSEAIKHFGSIQAVADALGITHGAVWQWPENLPIDRQAQIEILTGGALLADVPGRGQYALPRSA